MAPRAVAATLFVVLSVCSVHHLGKGESAQSNADLSSRVSADAGQLHGAAWAAGDESGDSREDKDSLGTASRLQRNTSHQATQQSASVAGGRASSKRLRDKLRRTRSKLFRSAALILVATFLLWWLGRVFMLCFAKDKEARQTGSTARLLSGAGPHRPDRRELCTLLQRDGSRPVHIQVEMRPAARRGQVETRPPIRPTRQVGMRAPASRRQHLPGQGTAHYRHLARARRNWGWTLIGLGLLLLLAVVASLLIVMNRSAKSSGVAILSEGTEASDSNREGPATASAGPGTATSYRPAAAPSGDPPVLTPTKDRARQAANETRPATSGTTTEATSATTTDITSETTVGATSHTSTSTILHTPTPTTSETPPSTMSQTSASTASQTPTATASQTLTVTSPHTPKSTTSQTSASTTSRSPTSTISQTTTDTASEASSPTAPTSS